MWDYNIKQGIPVDPAGKELAKRVTDQNEWIEVEILAQGNRIRVAINGTEVVDWRDPKIDSIVEGPIGLQLHQNKEQQEVRFKDITITMPVAITLLLLRP